MPPLESKKLLFQQAMTQNALNRLRGEDGLKIMLIDVKKAHLNGFVGEDEFVYIELPLGGYQGGTVWASAQVVIRDEAGRQCLGARLQ